MILDLFGLTPFKLNCTPYNGFSSRFDLVAELMECSPEEQAFLDQYKKGIVIHFVNQAVRRFFSPVESKLVEDIDTQIDRVTFRGVKLNSCPTMRVYVDARVNNDLWMPRTEHVLMIGKKMDDGTWYDLPVSFDSLRHATLAAVYGAGRDRAPRRVHPIFATKEETLAAV